MKISKILNFKPKLIPTLFTIPVLILLLALSFWQFQRLQWKEALIEEINQQIQIEAISLPDNVKMPEMLYRKVFLQGRFLHDKEIHVYGGSRQFKGEVGYYILTPMVTSSNKLVIINRGWVPEKLKKIETRPETLVKDEVRIEGAIMQSEQKNVYVHDNQLDKNLWFYINLNEIKAHLSMPIENFYILNTDNSKLLPRGRDLDATHLLNNHLGYALTWLFSAISLLVIYIVYHQKRD
jgi:surfeit locus 1 family protein